MNGLNWHLIDVPIFFLNFSFALYICVFVDNWPVDCLTFFPFVYKIRCICIIQMHTLIIVYHFIFLLAVNVMFFFVLFQKKCSLQRKQNHSFKLVYILRKLCTILSYFILFIFDFIFFFFGFIYCQYAILILANIHNQII